MVNLKESQVVGLRWIASEQIREQLDSYARSGHAVVVHRFCDSRGIRVSLDGFRQLPLQDALIKVRGL